MNHTKLLTSGMVLLATLLAASVSLAADLPRWYPDNFNNLGMVTSKGSGTITMGTETYKVAKRVKVHTTTSRKADLSRIKEGDMVAFELRGKKKALGKGAKGIIKEIWLMPKGDTSAFEGFL